MTSTSSTLQVARFDQLQPKSRAYAESHGVPAEAFETLAAKTIYLLMAPDGAKGSNKAPAIHGAPGLTVQICRCPPGNGPMSHRHVNTVENFMCLQGEFTVKWGERGEHSAVLKPYDMISVPPSEYRAFVNTHVDESLLLVMIQGDNDKLNDVTYAPGIGDMVVERFGAQARDKLEQAVGWNFA